MPTDEIDNLIQIASKNPVISSKYGPHGMKVSESGADNVSKRVVENFFKNPNEMKPHLCREYLRHGILMMSGDDRTRLLDVKDASDLQTVPHSNLQRIFVDDKKREKLRKILFDAFGDYIVIDPTWPGKLRVRFSDSPPQTSQEEKSFTEEALSFHKQATEARSKSDGVKAFSGVMLELIAGNPIILLIDEPEAFLHPSLAFKLGKQIALSTNSLFAKRVFVATHSASFLRGCLQAGVPVNIVRMTYRENVATARLLLPDDLVQLMSQPLLRSSGALQGLFSEHVIVCEGDSDRAFYDEINERLSLSEDARSVPNCLIINAHGKEQIPNLLKPLRKMGIPAASIIDLDILKKGGAEWANQMSAIGIPKQQMESMAKFRLEILKSLEEEGNIWEKSGGVLNLSNDSRESAENLLQILATYGMFVVPGGSLESWLKDLGVSARKSRWLFAIFEKMGVDPQGSNYVKPCQGDVWEFMGAVRRWMVDPARRGIYP